jgi:hypothetical protein
MYDGFKKGGFHSREWFANTQELVDHAITLSQIDNIRCPCNKCRNMLCHDKSQVTLHLGTHDFMPGYEFAVVSMKSHTMKSGTTRS